MPEHPHLTDLEQLLLLALLRLGGDAHGHAIQEDILEAASRSVPLGSVHVTLGRLEERGLARSRKGRPRGRRGGKARRLYTTTSRGRAALEWNRRAYERMWEGVLAEGET